MYGHEYYGLAFQYAAANGHPECVRFLLETGAVVNRDEALRLASENGHTEVVCLLLGRMRRASVRRIIEFHRNHVSPRTHRPPTAPLPTHPTRDDMIACLATAGKSFAHAYWTEGLPLFFSGLDLGPNPFL